MMFSRKYGLAMILVIFLSGCGSDDYPTDPPVDSKFIAGIYVSVRDMETGEPAMCGAIGWVVEGDYMSFLHGICDDSMPDSSQYDSMTGAYMRPGTYTVRITKEGYHDWVQENVEVTPNSNYVHTTNLVALLERK